MRRGPLALTYLDQGPDAPIQVGYAIGTRVGSAVVRNRLRRRLRAIVAGLAAEPSGLVPPGALLLRVAPEAAERRYEELEDDVTILLEALRRRRNETGAP